MQSGCFSWAVSLCSEERGGRVQDLSQLPEHDFEVEVVDLVGTFAETKDLARLAGLEHLRELRLAGPIWNRHAHDSEDRSSDIRYIASIQSIQKLTFSDHFWRRIRFGDAGIAQMQSLTNLRELGVGQTNITGHGLAAFQQLVALDATLTDFNDDGLANLSTTAGLRRLLIGSTFVTDDGLPELRGLQELEELDLHGTRITDKGVSHLAQLQDCGNSV